MFFFWSLWMVMFSFKHGNGDSRLFSFKPCSLVYILHFNIFGNLRTMILFFKQLTDNWESYWALLVSCNKLSQMGWFETAEMNSLPSQEARSLKSAPQSWSQGAGRAVLPLEALGGNSSLPLQLWWLLPFFALWLYPANLCAFSSVCDVSLCLIL